MKEADVVAKIHQEVRKQLPRAVYLKFADTTTTGIPDLEVTYGGRTTHVEVKLLRVGETPAQFRKHFSKLQLATCRLLEQQGRCQYFIAWGESAAIMRPHLLAWCLEKGAAGGADLWGAGNFHGTIGEAIDRLIWLVRQS
jgi:hypothetical protein